MNLFGLHFESPLWFIAIVPLIIVWFWLWKTQAKSSSWSEVCDPHLLPHLLEQQVGRKRFRLSLMLLALVWLVTIFSLAEPAWSKVKQPIYQQKTARIFLLDMSASMSATDLPPSRLDRAKFKLLDMLKTIKEGQTGLIAYTQQAFLVSPLTEDSQTIASMVPSLTADIMPIGGEDLTPALKMAENLFQQAHLKYGEIIVLTDSSPSAAAIAAAKQLKTEGISTSVLAVGTDKSVPLTNPDGQFMTDSKGAVETSHLPVPALKELANSGGGLFASFSNSNADVSQLLAMGRYEDRKSVV